MPARCDKHKVSLRRKWLGGKPGVYSEGLCYPCHYYRSS